MEYYCTECFETETSQWRFNGGPDRLCNRCGLRKARQESRGLSMWLKFLLFVWTIFCCGVGMAVTAFGINNWDKIKETAEKMTTEPWHIINALTLSDTGLLVIFVFYLFIIIKFI